MSEFEKSTTNDKNWDLQAIVKAQTSSTTTDHKHMNLPSNSSSSSSSSSYAYWFESLLIEDDNKQASYSTIFNELEALCQPFCHLDNNDQFLVKDDCPPEILDSANIDHQNQQKKQIITDVSGSSNQTITTPRRRRNKNKINVVQQAATGDLLLSDRWNWRKYGEKSIKGSRYPRSYYRCSSSGACLARKQVEQSNTNPGEFLITYMGEHCHPYPTRRHSQAGHNVRRFSRLHSQTQTNTMMTSSSVIGSCSDQNNMQNDHCQEKQKVLTIQQKLVRDNLGGGKNKEVEDDSFELMGREGSATSSANNNNNNNSVNDLLWSQNDDVFGGLDLDSLQGLGLTTSAGFLSDSDQYMFSFDHPFSSI